MWQYRVESERSGFALLLVRDVTLPHASSSSCFSSAAGPDMASPQAKLAKKLKAALLAGDGTSAADAIKDLTGLGYGYRGPQVDAGLKQLSASVQEVLSRLQEDIKLRADVKVSFKCRFTPARSERNDATSRATLPSLGRGCSRCCRASAS